MMHTHIATIHKIQAGELWLTYLLYALFITVPVGAFISVVKAIQYRRLLRRQPEGTDTSELALLISHYEWLNHTALVTLLLAMMTIGTAYYFVGYLFGVAALLWWVYRLGRGIVALLGDKAPPVTV